ncbi:MAG: hypothetical protein LBN29_08505 [Mediterranea sp.]|jgi:hypothetical protein|nr:hypothetical protein [Mediterranea sp.]
MKIRAFLVVVFMPILICGYAQIIPPPSVMNEEVAIALKRLDSERLAQRVVGADRQVDSIIIEYVNRDIMTIVSIPCGDFEANFPKRKGIVVKDLKRISEFKKILSGITNKKYVDKGEIDVRCKLYLFTDTIVSALCVDNFYVSDNDRLYPIVDELWELIESSIAEEVPIEKHFHEGELIFPNGKDSIYNYIKKTIYKYDIQDTLRIVITLNVDQRGNAVDIKIIQKKKGALLPKIIRDTLYDIFNNELKWQPSSSRPPKIREVLPIVIYPNTSP